jgi:hypothetical protein
MNQKNQQTKPKTKRKNYDNKLIIHYTHEKRFLSTKRDIHENYEDAFKNTPAIIVV